MLRSGFASCALAIAGLTLSPTLACADGGAPLSPAAGIGVAIVDFSYVDTSGEPTDQAAVHQKRLQVLMGALRRDVAADRRFRVVPIACGEVPCTADRAAPPDLLRAASEAAATILVIGGIHKQSTLVQWAKVDAVDVEANRVVFDRLFTFRGDSDEAWDRAAAFLSRQIRAALATADHIEEEDRP